MSFTLKPLPLLLASLCATPLAHANDTERTPTLGTVVVTGSYSAHDSMDLPAAIDSVNEARLDAGFNKVNVSDPLASVPGIVVLNRQNYAQDLQISSRSFGARSAFGVRGIRLLADGIPATMPDGQGQAATFNLDTAERLEVLRGPLSAVYGNHAGGVIQLFSKDGEGDPTLEGYASGGSFNSWKSGFGLQGKSGNVGYTLDSSHFASDGFRDHSASTRDQSQAKLTLQANPDTRVTILASDFHQKADDPLGQTWAGYQTRPESVAANALTYNTRKTIDHMQGGLNLEHRIGQHTLQLTGWLGSRQTVQYQSIPRASQIGVANVKHSGGVIDFDRQFSGIGARWLGQFALGSSTLKTTVGMEYEQSVDDRRGYENFIGTTVFGVKGNLRRKEEDSVTGQSYYAQGEWQAGRWVINGGLRHSRVSFRVKDSYLSNGDDSGNVSYAQTSPNVGVLYKLTRTVNLYASAARGFEAPTLNELFYSSNGGSFNFNLKAARSTHLETGIKALAGESTQLNLALFQIRTSDELVVDNATGGRTSYKNAGQTLRRGVELALDTQWQQHFSARLAATVMRATYESDFTSSGGTIPAGRYLPGVPGATLFGELAWQQAPLSLAKSHRQPGLSAALEVQSARQIYVEDSNTQQAAPGYTVFNLRLGATQEMGRWKVREYLRVNNLLDRQYVGSVVVGDSNSRYYEAAPGRNWLLGGSVSYQF
jgi:iron complex outermembrane receptor protein